MTRTSESMKARFSMLNSQFLDYDKDIKKYNDHINNRVMARDMSREATIKHTNNTSQKEQQVVMDNLEKIGKIVDEYGTLMSTNHLIDEINAYEKAVRDQDKQYQNMDERLLNNFG